MALKWLSPVVDITGFRPKEYVCTLFPFLEKYFTHRHSNLVALTTVDSSINNEYPESFRSSIMSSDWVTETTFRSRLMHLGPSTMKLDNFKYAPFTIFTVTVNSVWWFTVQYSDKLLKHWTLFLEFPTWINWVFFIGFRNFPGFYGGFLDFSVLDNGQWHDLQKHAFFAMRATWIQDPKTCYKFCSHNRYSSTSPFCSLLFLTTTNDVPGKRGLYIIITFNLYTFTTVSINTKSSIVTFYNWYSVLQK